MPPKPLTLETVPLSRLKLNSKNAKEHDAQQIEHLRASIRTFGFNDPIGVDGDYNIIEGHGRYQAAVEEGLDEVPVIRIDNLSARERNAYALAHNQTQLRSGLDMDKLNAELSRVNVAPEEFPALGFDSNDLLFLNPEVETSGEDTAEEGSDWSALVQPVVKTTLKFQDDKQHGSFLHLMDMLEARYPGTSPADRLLRLARELQPVATLSG